LIKKTSVCPLAESVGCALAEEWYD
jgi:hypothetical protein